MAKKKSFLEIGFAFQLMYMVVTKVFRQPKNRLRKQFALSYFVERFFAFERPRIVLEHCAVKIAKKNAIITQ